MALKAYFGRSLDVLKENTSRVLRAEAAPSATSRLVWRIDRTTDLKNFATGCDADIGGRSTCTLDRDEEGHGRFWGTLKTEVREEYRGKVRGGYAGFRNKSLPSLFGHLHHDLSLFSHLAIRVRPSGEPQTLRHWFVNIQTDGPVRSDLFQHRLPLPHQTDGKTWMTIHIPLASFSLTNSGAISETQVAMMTHKVRTIGFSLLGSEREAVEEEQEGSEEGEATSLRGYGPSVEGQYELGIQSVEAVNLDQASISKAADALAWNEKL